MSDTTMSTTNVAFWMDDQPVSTAEVMAVLRKEQKMKELIKNLILERAVNQVEFSSDQETELVNDFRRSQKLESDEALADFMQKRHITEPLLRQMISRPHRVVKYREERWGTRANSLYLKHKDHYDRISYRRLQSDNADVMQEVFFRLKDKEDSWETMTRQFPGTYANADALQERIPAAEIEAPLLSALRRAGPSVVIGPLQINADVVVVAELKSIEASIFNEELREQILRQEFDNWLQEECNKMLKKLEVPS